MKNKKLIYFALIVLFFVLGFIICQIYETSKNRCNNINIKPENYSTRPLEGLLRSLVDVTPAKEDCLAYALYYKSYLNTYYPKLDVRKIDMAGVCPIGTKECGDMEGMPHTYLIVNGMGGECLLDQTILMCHQLVYYPK